MAKLFLLMGAISFFTGLFGMFWACEKGVNMKGVNEDFYYGTFVISFLLSCAVSPVMLILAVLLQAWKWM